MSEPIKHIISAAVAEYFQRNGIDARTSPIAAEIAEYLAKDSPTPQTSPEERRSQLVEVIKSRTLAGGSITYDVYASANPQNAMTPNEFAAIRFEAERSALRSLNGASVKLNISRGTWDRLDTAERSALAHAGGTLYNDPSCVS